MLTDVIGRLGAGDLHWLELAGIGFFDCDAFNRIQGKAHVYDQDYFDNYRELADGPVAQGLNAFRVRMVDRLAADGEVILDVGIGDGAFLRSLEDARPDLRLRGCDINPTAIRYLEVHDQLGSLDLGPVYDVVTFWDSLEHFRDPRVPLRAVGIYAVVSLPTFADAGAAGRSKHFKPAEHFWYFTPSGFRAFANQEGFDVLDQLESENHLGREGISTFVLKRRGSE